MKKTVLKAAGILAATVLLFASCAADDSSYSSQIDTVLYLEKPQVSAKAYPGMNFVSWEPVANANGYVLYKYEDNNFKSSSSLSYTDLSYKDTDIKDGALYSYFVEAESKTSTGRSISTENTRSDKVSVKGIVPPSDVTTLNLYAYEDYGSKESPKGNKDFVVTSSNIKISNNEMKSSGKLSISFPGKAYLTYNLGYTNIDNQFDVQNTYSTIASNIRDNSTNDKIFYYGYTVTAPGIYKAVIRVDSENSLFASSPIVISDESVTIEKLNGTGGTISSASYTDLGKTVRVVFNEYVLNGSSVPESYYKVYRCEAGSYLYEPVSGTIAATNSSKATYFADDTVPDSTKEYEYRVVVTDGNSIAYDSETVSPYLLAAQSKTTVSGVKSSEDNDAVSNDITWTITLPSNDVVITGVYALEKSANYTGTVVAADFDRTSSLETTSGTDTTGKKFYVYTKNHTAGNKVYLLVTTSQENKKDGEWLSSAVTTSIDPISAPVISVAAYDSTITTATPSYAEKVKDDVIVNVEDTITYDDISYYTYTLYKTKSTVESDTTSITWDFTTSNWEKVTDLTMSKNDVIDSDSVNYVGIYKESDLSDGVYGYKVVKTRKDSGESVSKIGYVQIDCDSVTIKSTISAISASFESAASATSNVEVVYKISKAAEKVYGKILDTDNLVINWIGLPETGVDYDLYRTETTQNLTEVVWTKVELKPSVTDDRTPMSVSYDNSGAVGTKDIDVVTSQNYTYKDTGLSTGKSYRYMLVATKGTKQKSALSDKVSGAN
ncbi:MAG: hypothetical protein PUI78_00805 [Treponema sp.]|nr:hypothetical protein [Treponema sp.]